MAGVQSGKRLFLPFRFLSYRPLQKSHQVSSLHIREEMVFIRVCPEGDISVGSWAETGPLGAWGLKMHPRVKDDPREQSIISASTLKRQRYTLQP